MSGHSRFNRSMLVSLGLSPTSADLVVEQLDFLEQRVVTLEQALGTARATIQAFHGEVAWPEYQHSPEMKQINAALAKP